MNKKIRPEYIYRNCPICNNLLKYKNTPDSRHWVKESIKIKRACKICSQRLTNKNKGVNNYWFGKTNTHLIKTNKKRKGVKLTGAHLEKSRETIKIAKKAQGNKSFYLLWIDKYGKEIADKKLIEYKKKKSEQTKGEKNPMFGNPAPNGSGNGWKGAYKGTAFRSLRELIYLIDVIEKNNYSFISCHALSDYRISYIGKEGQKRNYFPDFLVNDKTLVECKPKKLWLTKDVQIKKEAAEKFCVNKNLKYELYDCTLDDFKQILINKHNKKELIFDARYTQKFIKYHNL